MDEFDFRRKVIDGVPLVDLIEILELTVEDIITMFDNEFDDKYNELKEYLGEDTEDPEETEI